MCDREQKNHPRLCECRLASGVTEAGIVGIVMRAEVEALSLTDFNERPLSNQHWPLSLRLLERQHWVVCCRSQPCEAQQIAPGHLAKSKTLNRTSEPQPKLVIQIRCWRGPAEHRRFGPSSLRS